MQGLSGSAGPYLNVSRLSETESLRIPASPPCIQELGFMWGFDEGHSGGVRSLQSERQIH